MIIFAVILLTGLIILANRLEDASQEQYRRLFDWLLLLINIGLLLFGGLVAVVPDDVFRSLQSAGSPPINAGAFGLTIGGMALWGMIVSARPTRRLLSSAIPVRPDSPVHALALILAGYLVGSTLLTLSQGGLEDLAATAAPAGLLDILAQFFMFVFLALFGVGLFTRRNAAELVSRLGLVPVTRRQVFLGAGWIILLVLLQGVVGDIWSRLNPSQTEVLEEISGALLGEIDTVWEWLILAMATGIGEELLFRGAIQPVLGLYVTAGLFAVAHVQYGIATPVTAVVFIIGVVFGRIRRDHGTTLSMLVHTGYNFVLGLMALIAIRLAG